MSRDWAAWHRDYADPGSDLSQRLVVVTDAVRAAIDDAPPGPIRVLSLCCGEARDLTAAANGHARAGDLTGCAVELSGGLAAIAATNLADAGTGIEVRCADAGRSVHWLDVTPVDLLVLAGIFGNITDDDIARIVRSVPALVRPGGHVVWTRHRRGDDITPQVRQWFADAGCTELAFHSPGAGKYGVGVHRFDGPPRPGTVPEVVFRFTDP
jgi:SAM-dependent methyltransferase